MANLFSSNNSGLDFGRFRIEIKQKKIKHIYFRVYPSDKRIVVSAPCQLSSRELEQAILSKRQWLLKQINRPVRQKESTRYLAHDTAWFKGKPYPIRLYKTKSRAPSVMSAHDHIGLYLKAPKGNGQILAIIENWLRTQLYRDIGVLVEKWTPQMGVRVFEYRIRKMRTRWGSCNIKARRIWLNFALIHLPVQYLEYVVVHEMVHLLERKHNHRFEKFMDRFVPNWRQLKQQMARFSL